MKFLIERLLLQKSITILLDAENALYKEMRVAISSINVAE